MAGLARFFYITWYYLIAQTFRSYGKLRDYNIHTFKDQCQLLQQG